MRIKTFHTKIDRFCRGSVVFSWKRVTSPTLLFYSVFDRSIDPFLYNRNADYHLASRRASTAKLGGHSGIQRWYLGSTDPMGRVACDGNAPLTPATTLDADFPASAIAGDHRGGANVLMDQTLRTRVRFEMAPGVLIPPEIGSLPGDVENSALRIFAAGGALDDLSRRHRRQRQRAQTELLTERVLSKGDSLSGGSSGCGGDNGKGGWEQDVLFTSKERNFAPVEEGVHRGEEGRACVGEGIDSAPALDETDARLAAEAVETAKLEEALEEWRRATLYWVHPATPLPTETFSAKKAAYAEIAKRPGHAMKVEGGVHPGGSAASGCDIFYFILVYKYHFICFFRSQAFS